MNLDQENKYIELTSRIQNIVNNPQLDKSDKQQKLLLCMSDKNNVFQAIRSYQKKNSPRGASLSPFKTQNLNRHKNHSQYIMIHKYLRQNLWRNENKNSSVLKNNQGLQKQSNKIPKHLLHQNFVRKHRSQQKLTIKKSDLSKQTLNNQQFMQSILSFNSRSTKSLKSIGKIPQQLKSNIKNSRKPIDLGITMNPYKAIKFNNNLVGTKEKNDRFFNLRQKFRTIRI